MFKSVLFDFDGTLTSPGYIDFDKIKISIKCPDEIPILEYINSLKNKSQQSNAYNILDIFEAEAALNSKPNVYCEDLLNILKQNNIPYGVLSRNSKKAVYTALNNFKSISIKDFLVILTRDDNIKIKPDPHGIFVASKAMCISPKYILMVGDHPFDIIAGKRAGCSTAFLINDSVKNKKDSPIFADYKIYPDYFIESLKDLFNILKIDP